MKSVMKHQFSKVPSTNIQRSSFDRSSGLKTTFNSGDLIPIFFDEVLPGDTFKVREHMFGRLATPLFPFMDNVFLDTFYFFVPNRLIWDNWQRFNGEQPNPGDTTDFLVPQVVSPDSTGFDAESIYDYFGIPTAVPKLPVNSLHLRAYNLIWNEWFRDQNLQDAVDVPKDDGPDDPSDFKILKRGKRHDYFTSCLPWPQKGPAVELPLGENAPVYGVGTTGASTVNASNFNLWDWAPAAGIAGDPDKRFGRIETHLGNPQLETIDNDGATQSSLQGLSLGTKEQYEEWAGSGVATPPYADLADATAATINALREAFQIQKLYERDARGGTRYTEIIRSHFGVISPDARLQRPEYLGGGRSHVNIHPVAQTSESTETGSPQGTLAAFGTVSSSNGKFIKSFTEHGVIIGLACVRADLNYQQGLNKMWSRRTRFDYYWPALSHLGEQAVLNREIYAQGNDVTDEGGEIVDEKVFGYQERYAEYRYKPSLITGQFRSNYAQSLDQWHLAQDFESLPVLNDEFIEEQPPIDRVVAVPSEPQFIMDCYFQTNCVRPMPVYSVPGLIDHF